MAGIGREAGGDGVRLALIVLRNRSPCRPMDASPSVAAQSEPVPATLAIARSTARFEHVNSLQQRLTTALGRSDRVEREPGAASASPPTGPAVLAAHKAHERVGVRIVYSTNSRSAPMEMPIPRW